MFSIEQFQMLWELSKQLNPALHNQEVPILCKLCELTKYEDSNLLLEDFMRHTYIYLKQYLDAASFNNIMYQVLEKKKKKK